MAMVIQYPKVKHKLPPLFIEIIRADKLKDILLRTPVDTVEQWVKRKDHWNELKKRRTDYTIAAEKYVQRQKGS